MELPTCFGLARVCISTEGFAGVVTFMLFVNSLVIFLMMWSRVYYRYIYYFRDRPSCTLAWIASAIKGISQMCLLNIPACVKEEKDGGVADGRRGVAGLSDRGLGV